MLDFFKAVKERFEPLIWLVYLIAAVIGALVTTWKFYIDPAITSYFNAATAQIVAELAEVKTKLTDEFDSTYYFTKTFTFGNPSLRQEPLAQFFYAARADKVSLYIWSEGEQTKEVIKINGGKDLTLMDIEASSWTDVDITRFVQSAGPLTIENYQGITRNIYEIFVTPIPLKDFSRKKEEKRNFGEVHGPSSSAANALRDVSNIEREVTVYCLLIVKRSPFKSTSK